MEKTSYSIGLSGDGSYHNLLNVTKIYSDTIDNAVWAMRKRMAVKKYRQSWDIIFDILLSHYFQSKTEEEIDNTLFAMILRAGLSGFLAAKDWILDSNMAISSIWTARDDENGSKAELIHCNIPKTIPYDMSVLIVDPLCATGGSTEETIKHYLEHHALEKNITCVFGIAAPEGLIYLSEKYPKMEFIVGETGNNICLNEKNYVVYADTGEMVARDAGDRLMRITGDGELLNKFGELCMDNKHNLESKGGENV